VSLEQFKTQVLILHSEQKTLDILSTGFNDRYSVHCATSGTEALSTLGQTPIHVIICAQDLPGMSGLDALREARKRSPDMIGILLAGSDQSDGLEALVGEQEVFEIVRGEVKPDDLKDLVEKATKRVRMMAIAESANDTAANLDVSADEFDMSSGEHIVMETADNGSTIISDGSGILPTLKPERIQVAPNSRGRNVDVLVLSKDEEFLATIKESSLGLHDVHHAVTPSQAEEFAGKKTVGVLVTDAAMVGSNIEALTQRLRTAVPRLVAIVAGRRDDGELLMDLINRGQVYRFLLKPVSPGRVRLAIEASVKYHLDAPDSAFKGKPRTMPAPAAKPARAPVAAKKPALPVSAPPRKIIPATRKQETAGSEPDENSKLSKAKQPEPMRALVREERPNEAADLDTAFDEGRDFAETMTDIAVSVGKSVSGVSNSMSAGAKSVIESSGKAFSGIGGLIRNPKIPAIAGGVVVVAIAATWMMMGDNADEPVLANEPPPPAASIVEEASNTSLAAPAAEIVAAPVVSGDLLQRARDARDAGNIVSPAGDNAMEFYVAALNEVPNDEAVVAELDSLTEEVFGMAETALLANQTTEAARALRVIALAVPESPRLNFLKVQLDQQRFDNLMDQAQIATSETRFEDAGRLLMEAEGLSVADSGELDALSAELAAARNEQQSLLDEQRQGTAQQAEAERLAAATAAAKRAESVRLAETERVAAEETAAKQAVADRVAAEEAAARQAEASRVAAEEAAATKAEADRVAAEVAAAKQAEADRVVAEQAAAKQAETDRVVAEEAAARQAETDRVAVEQTAVRQAEADHVAAEQAAAKQAETDYLKVDELALTTAAALPLAAGPTETETLKVAVAAKPEPAAISAVKRIHYVGPKYPRSAQRRDIAGWVDLAFTVTTSGEVAEIEILNAEPENIFDKAATRAVAQWLFEPATEDNVPIEKRIALRLSFNLQ